MRLLALMLSLLPGLAHAAGLTVFAAASLANALPDIGRLWQAQGHAAPSFVFESSSTLARQIEAGAGADLFVSADQRWMDDAAAHGAVDARTRVNLVGNTLVLVEPKSTLKAVTIRRGFDIEAVLGPGGRLAVGDPRHVPAGIYAEQALRWAGAWGAVAHRLAPAENVRAALLLVERGEAPAGIVYGTDVRVSPLLATAGVFPPESHDRITYPAAVTRRGGREARAFLALLGSAAAGDVFRHYGFPPP